MPLRFGRQTQASPPPAISRAAVLRLMSMATALVLVIYMMKSLKTPEAEIRFSQLLGTGATSAQAHQPTPEADRRVAELHEQLDHELLRTVDDDTRFRTDEQPAWFHLISVVRDADPAVLHAASVGNVVYSQLMSQPEAYRGKVISVRGIAHRVEKLDPGKNDIGLDQIYRVVVQPGGTDRLPFLFYCLDLPEGVQPSEEKLAVQIDGMFFKNRVYGHELGIDKSPVLVSQSFATLSSQAAPQKPKQPISVGMVVSIAVFIAVGIVVVLLPMFRREKRPAPSHQQVADVGVQLAQLDSLADEATTDGDLPDRGATNE